MEEHPEVEAEAVDEMELEEEVSAEVSFGKSSFAELDSQEASLWQRLWRFFLPSGAERREAERQRLQELNDAIYRYPQAAVNYLLRGELHLAQKQYEFALEDLQMALNLAEEAYKRETWGLSSQAIADRARRGLEEVLRYS